MSSEESKVIALKYYSVFNSQNLAEIEEFIDPEFVITIGSYPDPLYGPEGFRQLISMMHAALPDLHFSLNHLIAQDNIAVGDWTSSGTHTGGPFVTAAGALPANGNQFTIHGISWLRIENGKLKESYVCEDAIGLLKQLGGLPTDAKPTHLATVPEKGDLVKRYFEDVMTQGKLDLIDDLVTPDFTLTILTLPDPIRGPEGLKQFVTRLRGALPDLNFTLGEYITEGDKVVARWKNVGTHAGSFLGAAPTGKSVSDHGVDIFRIANGKIAEIWIYEHDLQLMQQLEAISLPASVAKY
jgi:steroid delta-isomerase-like uncharacterized protein